MMLLKDKVDPSKSSQFTSTLYRQELRERAREREREDTLKMEVGDILHMNGGVGESSYANNSLVQVSPLHLLFTLSI